VTRRYLPTTLTRLAAAWDTDGPEVLDPVVAEDEGEETEYAALMTAADASAELLAGLPDGRRRRVVVVVETASAEGPARWRVVVAVHVDSEDDADADDDLAWWATQEIGDLLASL
jgi:glycine cleavage system regulatory protein